MSANNVIGPGPSCPIQMEVCKYNSAQLIFKQLISLYASDSSSQVFLYTSLQPIQLIGLWSVHQRQGQSERLTVNFATTLSPLVRIASLALAR